jgi:hypothetical protein
MALQSSATERPANVGGVAAVWAQSACPGGPVRQASPAKLRRIWRRVQWVVSAVVVFIERLQLACAGKVRNGASHH